MLLDKKKQFATLVKESGQGNAIVKRLLQSLQEKGFIGRENVSGSEFYAVGKELELPPTPIHPLLGSLSQLPVLSIEAMSLIREQVEKDSIAKILQKLWKNIVVKKIDLIYLPVYETFLRKKDGRVRKLFIEAVTGKEMKLGFKVN